MIDYCVNSPLIDTVSDAEYLPKAKALISNAVERVICSIFIIDLNVAQDPEFLVHDLMLNLQAANWRGLDVRLLIGGSRTNYDIALTAETARSFSDWLGVDCRWLTSQDVRGSHTKFLIADNQVITGSHNWSGSALSDQVQDSLLFNSPVLAEQFSNIFEYQWWRARDR